MIRSVLYVPASRPGMLEKLSSLTADFLILDLEDGVAPREKDAARENLCSVADGGTLPKHRNWALRVNPPGSTGHLADLDLVARLRPPLVVLPKAEEPGQADGLSKRFREHGSNTALMIETAAGVANVRQLAMIAGVTVLIYGSADFRLSLGARPDPDRVWERHAMGEILLAARVHHCAAVDAVYFRFKDAEGLMQEAKIAKGLGFDGKSCIHPCQVGPIHDVFSSTPEEIAWAGKVLAAWEDQGGTARGVIVVDGEMIEALHLEVARRILNGAG